MDWAAFWSGLIGTTIPGLGVSALLVYLNKRTSVAIEKHKLELAQELAKYNNKLEQNVVRFSQWHEKRIKAFIEIYDVFREHLDFLRKALYFPEQKIDVTPLHNFHGKVEQLLLYFDDDLQKKVNKYSGELLEFWNWAISSRDPNDSKSLDAVRHRLDHEIPQYLTKLRLDINLASDPNSNLEELSRQ